MAQPLVLLMAPDQSQRLEALLHRVTSVDIGTLFSFDELFALTRLHDKRPLYWLIIRANKELIPTKTMLVNVRGQGYRKATAPQMMNHANGRRLRGIRQFRKEVLELVYTDRKQLTAVDMLHLDNLTQLANIRYHAAIRKSLKAQAMQRQASRSQEEAFQDMANAVQAFRKHFPGLK